MQLADWQIHENQRKARQAKEVGSMIMPYDVAQLQPASYDLRLGRQLRNEHGLAWTMRMDNGFDDEWPALGRPLYEDMEPGRFVLGHTLEYIRMPAHLCGRVEGKSSIGRQGLAVHVTAGFIDPGFEGQITLELKYQGTMRHMKVWPGMLIAQITFHVLAARPQRLYGDPRVHSHYQHQLGATPPAR
jgi:dCTP deaminase